MRVSDGDGRDPVPATRSDLGNGGVIDDFTGDLGDGPRIFLESGAVFVLGDSQDSSPLFAALSGSDDYGYFIDVDGSSHFSRIFVPSDYIDDSFCVDSSNHLFGCRSGTITCLTDSGYSVRFPSYATPQYRAGTGSSTWQDVDLIFVDSPNVSVFGARLNWWSDEFRALILISLGGLLVCLYLKR